MRAGDSRDDDPIYDPARGHADGTARTPFPNNRNQQKSIDTFALKILANIPLPRAGVLTEHY